MILNLSAVLIKLLFNLKMHRIGIYYLYLMNVNFVKGEYLMINRFILHINVNIQVLFCLKSLYSSLQVN